MRWVVKDTTHWACWFVRTSERHGDIWGTVRKHALEFTDLAEARAAAKRNPGCKVYRVRGT